MRGVGFGYCILPVILALSSSNSWFLAPSPPRGPQLSLINSPLTQPYGIPSRNVEFLLHPHLSHHLCNFRVW